MIAIDTISEIGWCIPLIKKGQTVKDEFSNITTSSKRKPSKIKSDRGKEG